MKGLKAVPSLIELQKAYDRLQAATSLIEGQPLALYSQWARLDPRLAEVLTGHLTKYWREIPLGHLIDSLKPCPWPRAITVLCRFVALSLTAIERKTVLHIIDAIEGAYPKPSPQLFFIPLQVPNSVILREEVKFSTEPYAQAGYIGAQSLLPRARAPANRTLMPRSKRHLLLSELFAHQKSVTVNDLIRACKGMVSRRQAQRDLCAFKGLSAKGFTRGRVYQK